MKTRNKMMIEDNHDIDNVLGDGAFWKVNKRITQEVGLIASAILFPIAPKPNWRILKGSGMIGFLG